MTKRDQPQLPAANEFTSGQLGGAEAMFEVLGLLVSLSGNRDKILEAIRSRWFDRSALSHSDVTKQREQQLKRAANVVSGMRQYGLLDSSTDPLQLSDLGAQVIKLQSTPEAGYALLATYLLREKHGLELLELARAIRARDGSVGNRAIDKELVDRGYYVPTHSTSAGKLRGWLEVAGLVDHEWNVNDTLVAELSGIEPSEIHGWLSLSPEQRAVIQTLRVRYQGNTTPIQSSELLDLLRQRGTLFDGGQVKKTMYGPLAASGWIKHDVATGGRGGKGGLIEPTPKALQVDIDLIDELELGSIPIDLQAKLSTSTTQIILDLKSPDINVKGTALELLSLRLASDLGLIPVEMRLRSFLTGGAEVDLVAEAAHLHFSRWLFQCKNQRNVVTLSILAKEVGVATLLRAQVVVIVTTSTFAKSVVNFAKQISETTALQVILIDGSMLAAYRTGGVARLRSDLNRHALASGISKRSQLASVPEGV